MSDKQKFPINQAEAVGFSLMAQLRPFSSRLQMAGSIRRRKPLVSDIEILYVPKVEKRPSPEDFLATINCDLIAEDIGRMLKLGIIEKRLNVKNQPTWGPQNKLAIHVASGIPVDFFATTEANWWVALVIRTGSKETNLALTTGAQRRGLTLNAYGCGVTDEAGTVTPATSEQHVFELCGIPYLEPKDR